jgi:hypothetical protein
MEITFTKAGQRTYEVLVLRDDGVTLRVRTPDKPLKINAEDALRVCRALRETESLWTALPVGESIKVTWASAQRKSTTRRRRA